jgi:hypothetical protein
MLRRSSESDTFMSVRVMVTDEALYKEPRTSLPIASLMHCGGDPRRASGDATPS